MAPDKNGGPNYLQAWRENAGMSQEELGDAAGTTGSVISLLESGERGLSAKWLRRLAPILKTTPGWLLDHHPSDVSAEIYEMWASAPEPQRRQAMRVLRALRSGTDD